MYMMIIDNWSRETQQTVANHKTIIRRTQFEKLLGCGRVLLIVIFVGVVQTFHYIAIAIAANYSDISVKTIKEQSIMQLRRKFTKSFIIIRRKNR